MCLCRRYTMLAVWGSTGDVHIVHKYSKNTQYLHMYTQENNALDALSRDYFVCTLFYILYSYFAYNTFHTSLKHDLILTMYCWVFKTHQKKKKFWSHFYAQFRVNSRKTRCVQASTVFLNASYCNVNKVRGHMITPLLSQQILSMLLVIVEV